jgi:hypothetical protein
MRRLIMCFRGEHQAAPSCRAPKVHDEICDGFRGASLLFSQSEAYDAKVMFTNLESFFCDLSTLVFNHRKLAV